MNDSVILVEDLTKIYHIGAREDSFRTFRDVISSALSAPARRLRKWIDHSIDPNTPDNDHIYALKDVSFEVKKGEVVGVIGRNGAGKSTLLKILSRITEPSSGYAQIRGRIGSLLEVGTGFHPELTGRENIYLNGAILGMRKAEIQTKFDEIVAFSELDKFLDTPVKHYSSGMYVRLAFAVAAHLEPEVLLIDEVLAVGDLAFQKKCQGKMGDVAQHGRTILFVSHNIAAIQKLCNSALLLDEGRIVSQGETQQILLNYISRIEEEPKRTLNSRTDRTGTGALRWTKVFFERNDGQRVTTFLTGDEFIVNLEYESSSISPNSDVLAGISIKDRFDQTLFLCTNQVTGQIKNNWPQTGRVRCKIPRLPLISGIYNINLYVSINGSVSDWVQNAASFQVQSADFFGTGQLPPSTHGSFLVDHFWELHKTT